MNIKPRMMATSLNKTKITPNTTKSWSKLTMRPSKKKVWRCSTYLTPSVKIILDHFEERRIFSIGQILQPFWNYVFFVIRAPPFRQFDSRCRSRGFKQDAFGSSSRPHHGSDQGAANSEHFSERRPNHYEILFQDGRHRSGLLKCIKFLPKDYYYYYYYPH